MEPEQLLTYLRSLRAEEIRKIEVVPVTGADYDADSAGGVIRITLKKRRENGIDGSVAYNTTQSGITDRHNPRPTSTSTRAARTSTPRCGDLSGATERSPTSKRSTMWRTSRSTPIRR